MDKSNLASVIFLKKHLISSLNRYQQTGVVSKINTPKPLSHFIMILGGFFFTPWTYSFTKSHSVHREKFQWRNTFELPVTCFLSFCCIKTQHLEKLFDFVRNIFHRRTAGWLKIEGTAGDHLFQPPCPSRAAWCQLLRTIPKLLFLRMVTPQPPCSICTSAWSSSQQKMFFWCSEGTAYISFCADCLWSRHWAPLERAPSSLLSSIRYLSHWRDPPKPSAL